MSVRYRTRLDGSPYWQVRFRENGREYSVDYITDYESEDGSTELSHLDGVRWYKAPKPRRWHRCRAQTRGWMNYFELVERCACGAIRLDGHSHWMQRNSR